MFCLYCGGRLPLLRDLALGEFCSPEHREHFERLEHEFQESDPGRTPARCPLAPLTPPMHASAVTARPGGAQSVAPIPAVSLPGDQRSDSSARARLTSEPVRIAPVRAEPGYVGPLTH